jgi:uncharacterized protein YjbI with pentapeptide repeats/endonuclease YncB( thermonuclease family)
MGANEGGAVNLTVVAAVAAGAISFWLARESGYSGWTVVVYTGIVGGAAIVATRTQTPRDKLADAGRGIVVAVLLALIANSISHRDEVRTAKDSLRLTLSSGGPFTGIDLRNKDLSGAYIGGKHLSDADLRGVDLDNAVLSHSTLRNTDFHGSATDLSNADLSFADLSGADLRSVRLNGADLTEANLRDARLAGAQLRDATLEGAHLEGADLRGADLRSAVLLGAHLQQALLIDADLGDAELTGDLRPAGLKGAALSGVKHVHTRWPKGFDLERAIKKAEAPPRAKVEIPLGAAQDVVSSIADGDTLELQDLGHVRLLALDAPSEGRSPDCYGANATEALERLIPPGTSVRYTLGNTRVDDFDRKLAYLWLPEGTFVNERLVADGDARFAAPPRKKELPDIEQSYARRIKRDSIRAAMGKRGLWSACSSTSD